MPFTFSHPAAILPLLNRGRKKRLFSATGLIIGSIIPDFESFIRFDQHKAYSHTWLGVLWYDLPLAIIYSFIFHNLVRNALIRNLPGRLEYRFLSYEGFNWNKFFVRNWQVVICSMLIGIMSHLLWDAITHLNLADPNATNSHIRIGRHLRLYILLQYMSSVIGLFFVMRYLLTSKKKPVTGSIVPNASNTRRKYVYWLLVAVIACFTLLISGFLIDEPLNSILFIEISISGLLLGTILGPIVQRLFSGT